MLTSIPSSKSDIFLFYQFLLLEYSLSRYHNRFPLLTNFLILEILVQEGQRESKFAVQLTSSSELLGSIQ